MSNTIGAIGCTFVHGHVPLLKQRVETWQMPGIDGYGAQHLGLGDAQFSVRAVMYGGITAVNAWAVSLENLQGSVVTIANGWPIVSAGCLITRVHAPVFAARWGPHGNARGEVRIEGVRVA